MTWVGCMCLPRSSWSFRRNPMSEHCPSPKLPSGASLGTALWAFPPPFSLGGPGILDIGLYLCLKPGSALKGQLNACLQDTLC